jgi:hypothetical protein
MLNNKTVLLSGLSFSFLNSGAFEYGTNQVAVNFGNSLNGFVGFDGQGQFPGFGLVGQQATYITAETHFFARLHERA